MNPSILSCLEVVTILYKALSQGFSALSGVGIDEILTSLGSQISNQL